jgi:hypothetical protein
MPFFHVSVVFVNVSCFLDEYRDPEMDHDDGSVGLFWDEVGHLGIWRSLWIKDFFMYISGYLYIGMYIRKSMGLFRDGAVISKSLNIEIHEMICDLMAVESGKTVHTFSGRGF